MLVLGWWFCSCIQGNSLAVVFVLVPSVVVVATEVPIVILFIIFFSREEVNSMETDFESTLPNLHALSVTEAVSEKAHQDRMDEDGVVEHVEAHNSADDDLDSISKVHKTRRYIDIMEMAEKMPELFSTQGIVLEEDAGLQLIADCFALRGDILRDIGKLYKFIRGKYHSRFPKLELSGLSLENYAQVVKKVGNEMDLTLVNLNGVISPTMISGFLKKVSTPCGKPLPDEVLRKVFDACNRLLVLSSTESSVSAFVDKITEYIAPNLFALLGSCLTSKLIMASGGLSPLANIPADNFNLLGPKNITNLERFLTEMPQFDWLEDTDFLARVHSGLEFNVYRHVAKKTTVAACVDCRKEDPTGKTGKCMRDEIFMEIERWIKEPYYGGYERKKSKRREDPLSKLKQKKRYATMRRMQKTKELIEMERMGFVAPRDAGRQAGIGQVSSQISCP